MRFTGGTRSGCSVAGAEGQIYYTVGVNSLLVPHRTLNHCLNVYQGLGRVRQRHSGFLSQAIILMLSSWAHGYSVITALLEGAQTHRL